MTIPESFYRYWFAQNSTPLDYYDYDSNGNMIYSGMAQVGTAQTSPGWVITKYVYNVVVISGKNVYLLVHDSTLVNVTWSLRTVYNFPN